MRPSSTYELRPPRSGAELDTYHSLREHLLFDRYHAPGTSTYCPYLRDHPDERDPRNHPLVLVEDGAVVGTIRIDLKADGRAVFRQITIDERCQGRRLGARLLTMAEAFAEESGATRACLNAVAPAVGFYQGLGYRPYRWEGCTSCPTSVPVAKALAALPPAWMVGRAAAHRASLRAA